MRYMCHAFARKVGAELPISTSACLELAEALKSNESVRFLDLSGKCQSRKLRAFLMVATCAAFGFNLRLEKFHAFTLDYLPV